MRDSEKKSGDKNEDIEKIVKDEVKEAIKERLGNPFICSFVIAWLLINWQLVSHLLFGSGGVSKRIVLILEHHSKFTYVFLLPIISAFVFVIVAPWLEVLAEYIQSKARTLSCKLYFKRRATLKLASEEADLRSSKEFKLKRIEHEREVLEKEKELEDLKVDLSDSKDLAVEFAAWTDNNAAWNKRKSKELNAINAEIRKNYAKLEDDYLALDTEFVRLQKKLERLETNKKITLQSNLKVKKGKNLSADEIADLTGVKSLEKVDGELEVSENYKRIKDYQHGKQMWADMDLSKNRTEK